MKQTISDLNGYTVDANGEPFYEISSGSEKISILSSLGVENAKSDSTGGIPSRVRYYLVNGLLYALFTTPKGSKLVGIDNPRGYPGGFATYI